MTATVSRGRPSKYGKSNENKQAIVNDLKKPSGATPYYIQKLMKMGFLELTVTDKGKKFVEEIEG